MKSGAIFKGFEVLWLVWAVAFVWVAVADLRRALAQPDGSAAANGPFIARTAIRAAAPAEGAPHGVGSSAGSRR